jgi:hypothetical protein
VAVTVCEPMLAQNGTANRTVNLPSKKVTAAATRAPSKETSTGSQRAKPLPAAVARAVGAPEARDRLTVAVWIRADAGAPIASPTEAKARAVRRVRFIGHDVRGHGPPRRSRRRQ